MNEPRVVEMSSQLCDKILNGKDQHRDTASIALKTVDCSVPDSGWHCLNCNDNTGDGRRARPIMIRLTQVDKEPEYEMGGCVVCRLEVLYEKLLMMMTGNLHNAKTFVVALTICLTINISLFSGTQHIEQFFSQIVTTHGSAKNLP
ncbi:unnamed protein product [Trifolium pratense]|uniref:Uncharacterized protein n=1 Tax=Trifolium pratense TaxID=57577 RepID=A0ACB0JE61_TRIPR|nr:unnamed protein product [Trifolium pratense]